MDQTNNLVFTPDKVEVSNRIKNGRTFFFVTKHYATKFANSIRSYVYVAYDQKGSAIGFCVPK